MQGLEIESVSITDKAGNIYLTGDALSGDSSALKLQLQQSFENRMRTQIMNVLTPLFGEDNVRVGVTCEVEIDRTTAQGKDIYLPEDAEDGRGIRDSEAWTWYITRPGEELPGGVVGTEVNSDLPEQVEAGSTPEDDDRTLGGSKQIDYVNPYREYQTDNNGAVRMTDCSVAVTINSRTAGDFNAGQIQQHVARAANIEGERDPITNEEYLDDKISVLAMDFYDPSTPLPGPGGEGGVTVQTWVLIAAGVGLLLFIILLTTILLLRRKKRKKREEEEERQRQEAEALLRVAGLGQDGVPAGGADVMDLEMERSMELRKDIRQFAQDNPEIAAQMIKGWLRGGDENG